MSSPLRGRDRQEGHRHEAPAASRLKPAPRIAATTPIAIAHRGLGQTGAAGRRDAGTASEKVPKPVAVVEPDEDQRAATGIERARARAPLRASRRRSQKTSIIRNGGRREATREELLIAANDPGGDRSRQLAIARRVALGQVDGREVIPRTAADREQRHLRAERSTGSAAVDVADEAMTIPGEARRRHGSEKALNPTEGSGALGVQRPEAAIAPPEADRARSSGNRPPARQAGLSKPRSPGRMPNRYCCSSATRDPSEGSTRPRPPAHR